MPLLKKKNGSTNNKTPGGMKATTRFPDYVLYLLTTLSLTYFCCWTEFFQLSCTLAHFGTNECLIKIKYCFSPPPLKWLRAVWAKRKCSSGIQMQMQKTGLMCIYPHLPTAILNCTCIISTDNAPCAECSPSTGATLGWVHDMGCSNKRHIPPFESASANRKASHRSPAHTVLLSPGWQFFWAYSG